MDAPRPAVRFPEVIVEIRALGRYFVAIFVLENSDIRNVMRQGKHTTRQPLANLVREILVMGIGCIANEGLVFSNVWSQGGCKN